MRAAVATGSSIEVRDDVADPTPGPGQVLVHTIVCGICGSDLHALAAPEEMAQLNAAGGRPALSTREIHTFSVMSSPPRSSTMAPRPKARCELVAPCVPCPMQWDPPAWRSSGFPRR